MRLSRSRFGTLRIARSHSMMRFARPSIIPSTCSATASRLPPAWLSASTPASVQASTSMVSKPAPELDTTSSSGQRPSSSAFAKKDAGTSDRAAEIW